MVRKRYRASNKLKRDDWVQQMAEDMPQLTQAEIAQRFGLEQSTVSRIMKRTIIKVVCMYCHRTMGLKDGQGVSGTSHSICETCWKEHSLGMPYVEEKK